MRNPLQIIADRVRVVVHGINTPFIPRAVMRRAQNPINDGVAQVHIWRGHVDFCAQTLLSVRVFARLHLAEQPQVFLDGTVSVRALRARFRERAARRADLFGGKVAYERFSVLYQLLRISVYFVEKVGGIYLLRPMIPHPFDVAANGVHKLRLFLGRVSIVEKQIALSAVLFRRPEIDQHALDVSDMQVSVGFGRKPRLNFLHPARFYVLVDDLLDKISRFYLFHVYPFLSMIVKNISSFR